MNKLEKYNPKNINYKVYSSFRRGYANRDLSYSEMKEIAYLYPWFYHLNPHTGIHFKIHSSYKEALNCLLINNSLIAPFKNNRLLSSKDLKRIYDTGCVILKDCLVINESLANKRKENLYNKLQISDINIINSTLHERYKGPLHVGFPSHSKTDIKAKYNIYNEMLRILNIDENEVNKIIQSVSVFETSEQFESVFKRELLLNAIK